jgi:uncharacterized RDD family membrane protein YckC/DNA-directed RNA polymerase subunit RPC12/RpoP
MLLRPTVTRSSAFFGDDELPIEFHCPFCDKMLRTPDAKAGRQADCPGCGERIFVPHESELSFEEADEVVESGSGDWFDQLGQLEAKPHEKRLVTASSRQSTGALSDEMADCPMCGEEVDVTAKNCPACGEPTATGGNSRRENPNDLVYAGFWLRFVAHLIDSLILAVPTSAIVAVCVTLFRNVPGNVPWNAVFDLTGFWVPELLLLLLTWPYYAPMESSRFQATFGKMLLGLIVTDLDGERVSFGRATGRHWAKVFSSFCFMLGYLTAGFDDKKQAWHDSISSCLVIRRPPDFRQNDRTSDPFELSEK